MEVSEGYLLGFLILSTLVLILASISVIVLIYRSAKKQIEHQKELISTSIEVAETVQQRIGMELHDGVGPDISVVKYQLAALESVLGDCYTREFNDVNAQLDLCLQQVRDISHSLVPQALLSHGLVSGIENFISMLSKSEHLDIHFVCKGDDVELRNENSLALYRIIQESISNAIRHGKANTIHIKLCLRNNESFFLIIEDNGVGFDVLKSNMGVGLKSIQLRSSNLEADLDVQSSYKGTTIKLTKNERY